MMDNLSAQEASMQHEDEVLMDDARSGENNEKQGATQSFSCGGLLEPCTDMTFDDLDDAKACYKAFARRVGFDVKVSHTRLSKSDKLLIGVDYACSREGNPKQSIQEKISKSKRKKSMIKIGCKAMMSVSLRRDTGKWVVIRFTTDHNHELYTPRTTSVLRGHKKITPAQKNLINVLNEAGIAPRKVMSVLSQGSGGEANAGCAPLDIQNHLGNKKRELLKDGDEQRMYNYCLECQSKNPDVNEMTLQDKSKKYAMSEKKRKATTEARQASLSRLTDDQEIPISTDGKDQEAIVQEKADKGSGSRVVPAPGKCHFVDIEFGDLADGQAGSDVYGAETASCKRSRPTTEIGPRRDGKEPTYQFPRDKDSMDALAAEMGLDMAGQDPENCSKVYAAVKRILEFRHIQNSACQSLNRIDGRIALLSNQLEKSHKDRSELEKKLAQERSQKDSEVTKLNQENNSLLARVHELEAKFKKKEEELSAENAQLVSNAKVLRDENCRLNEKVVMCKRQAVEAYKGSKEFLDDAKSAMLDLFNRASEERRRQMAKPEEETAEMMMLLGPGNR